MLKVGQKAPEFSLQSESGAQVALRDLAGKRVLLFFYPKADTPG
jgi:peroxiredoxin Q/BCP